MGYQGEDTSDIILIGDVRKVIQGQVQAQDMVEADTNRFTFALGGGTFGKLEDTGEAIVVAGRGYVKSSSTSEGYRLVSGTNLQTPFLMGIRKQSEHNQWIVVEKSKSLEELYQSLATSYKSFAVAGWGEFQELDSTTLKRAPIYGEEITASENRERYFHPVTPLKQVSGILFGVIQTAMSARDNIIFSQRMFYINFANIADAPNLLSHTHIALTANYPLDYEASKIFSAITAAEVKDVRHLLTQSRLQKAAIMVYPIGRVNEYRTQE